MDLAMSKVSNAGSCRPPWAIGGVFLSVATIYFYAAQDIIASSHAISCMATASTMTPAHGFLTLGPIFPEKTALESILLHQLYVMFTSPSEALGVISPSTFNMTTESPFSPGPLLTITLLSVTEPSSCPPNTTWDV